MRTFPKFSINFLLSNMEHSLFIFLIVFLSGCAGSMQRLYPPKPNQAVKSFYVVSHGWHTGIIINRNDIPSGLWPEHHDFKNHEYLEVGWGDEGFYQAKEITSGLTLKAIFWPTNSVLHIVGFSKPIEEYFAGSEIIKISVSGKGFENLVNFIHDSYATGEKGKPVFLRKGIYGDSKFYRAKGKYYLLNTCNIWTAEAIRSTGAPISTFYALTSGNTMYQAGRFGAPFP